MPVWAGLVLAMMCSGGVMAASSSQDKTLCLDKLYPHVQARYGFLPPPEGSPSPKQRWNGRRREKSGSVQSESRGNEAEQHLRNHVLFATYNFSVPGNDSENENDTEGSMDGRGDAASEEADVSGDAPQGRVEDVFDVDFILLSARVVLPEWWSCGGGNDTQLTVAVVGGDLLEDSDERGQAIRASYGDMFYFASLSEMEEVERRSKNITQFSFEDARVALSRTMAAREAWIAVEELRQLWHAPRTAQWSPQFASHLTEPPYNVAAGPSPAVPPGASPYPWHPNLMVPECRCDADCNATDQDRSSSSSEAQSDVRRGAPEPSPTRPYEHLYAPSNMSGDVFPGCLPQDVLTHHLHSPSASQWHTYRYAIDHHMHLTGIPTYPNIAAATFNIPASVCSQASPSADVHQQHLPGSTKEGARVVLDMTELLQMWFDEVSPWRRRTSRITLMFFKSNPRGRYDDSVDGDPERAETEHHTSNVIPSTVPPPGCPYSPMWNAKHNTSGLVDAPNEIQLPHRTSPRLSISYRIDRECSIAFICSSNIKIIDTASLFIASQLSWNYSRFEAASR